MRKPLFCGVGGVLSADIAVPEHDRELAFYSSVLATGATPLWQSDLLNNLGMPIIGLGQRTPEYERLPLRWMPHFQVADVATSVGAALALGGLELLHGKDSSGQSLWACLSDLDGVPFGLIPAVPAGALPEDPPGSFGHISWLSLLCPDPWASGLFYQYSCSLIPHPQHSLSPSCPNLSG